MKLSQIDRFKLHEQVEGTNRYEPVTVTDEWTFKPHSQLGSNPGAIFTDPSGTVHYIKFYRNPKQVESEYAGTKIHEMMGVRVLPIQIAELHNSKFEDYYHGRGIHEGSIGIMSPWNTNLKILGNGFYEINEVDAEHLGKSYIAAVLCENWDIVGMGVDNQVRDTKEGHLISVDHGGSFEFRAQGGGKSFEHSDIKSHQTLRKYSPASDVFDHVFSTFPEAEHAAVAKLHTLNLGKITNVFVAAGFSNASHMAEIVMSRVHMLLEHYDH